MKRKIIIRPIQATNAEIELKFDFRDSILNRDYFVPIDYSMLYTDKKYSKDMKPLRYRFKEINDVFAYEWDDEDGKSNDIALAMQRHPLIRCNGNDNLKNPFFELIDVGKKSVNDALDIKKKGLIFNLINNTSLGKMRDTAFAVGYNPINKSYPDIFIDLVDFNRGKLMQDLDSSIKLLEQDQDQVFVVMKKAIILGVVAQRDGLYYIKTDVVGDTEDKVLMYLKENTGIFEQYVRKEVALRDKLPAEDYDKLVMNEVGQFKNIKTVRRRTVDEEIEIKMLRDEARDLKIKGSHLIQSKERLEDVIRKAKERIESGDKTPLEVTE
jgi:hypothetical protein